jgi:hypothetical protein
MLLTKKTPVRTVLTNCLKKRELGSGSTHPRVVALTPSLPVAEKCSSSTVPRRRPPTQPPF